jgi:hypothetical protein
LSNRKKIFRLPAIVIESGDMTVEIKQFAPQQPGTGVISVTGTAGQINVTPTTGNVVVAFAVAPAYVFSQRTTPLTPTINAGQNVTSLVNLGAGTWDISGSIDVTGANIASAFNYQCGISAVSATLGAQGTYANSAAFQYIIGQVWSVLTPIVRMVLAVPTTIYLVQYNNDPNGYLGSMVGQIRANNVI